MGKGVSEEYDEWDLSPTQSPVRSILFSLEPIAAGTPWVESLTSYIARLADAHCVFPGVLIYRMIVPLMSGYTSEERRHPLFRADGDKSNLLNGTGIRATVAVQSLEKLTCRSDLRALTLLMWTNVLPLRGLIRLTEAWLSCLLRRVANSRKNHLRSSSLGIARSLCLCSPLPTLEVILSLSRLCSITACSHVALSTWILCLLPSLAWYTIGGDECDP